MLVRLNLVTYQSTEMLLRIPLRVVFFDQVLASPVDTTKRLSSEPIHLKASEQTVEPNLTFQPASSAA
jgi:hypothetical protein